MTGSVCARRDRLWRMESVIHWLIHSFTQQEMWRIRAGTMLRTWGGGRDEWSPSAHVEARQLMEANTGDRKRRWALQWRAGNSRDQQWSIGMMMCLVIEIQTGLSWRGKTHNQYYEVTHAQLLSCVRLFAILWTVAHQAPLSVGFPRQEY